MTNLMKYGESVQLTKETIKQYVCDKASDQECQMFFELCKMHGLNPFTGDANLVKYGTAPAQPVVTEKAWNRKLNEISDLEGIQDGIIVKTKEGKIDEREGEFFEDEENLVGGWCKIKMKGKEWVITKIRLSDYNKGQAMWKQIPARMICKTARVQNIRKAIPELGNMYTEAEMDGVNGTDRKQVINVTPDALKIDLIADFKQRIELAISKEEIQDIGEEIKSTLKNGDIEELRISATKRLKEIK